MDKWGEMDANGMDTSGLNAETFESENPVGGAPVNTEPVNQKEGRGLEIATLVFGILALVICCCNGFFGLIGSILGVIAIVKGKKSGITIAGFICSVLGLVFGLVILVLSFSDYGQDLEDAFMNGYLSDYESTTEESGDAHSKDMEEYREHSVISKEGTGSLSDDVAGRVVMDGMDIYIPCKLSELMEIYEVSEYSAEDVAGGLGSYESKSIYFAENGENNGVYVDVRNDTQKDLADIKDAKVGMISFDGDSGKQVEVLGGLSLGMTEPQIEEVLKDLNYNRSEMSGFVFYNVFAGEDSDYSVSVMMSEGEAINITLYYSGL